MIEMRGIQDGIVVFGLSGEDESFIRNECARYAVLYESEGPLKLQEKRDGRWRNVKIVVDQ